MTTTATQQLQSLLAGKLSGGALTVAQSDLQALSLQGLLQPFPVQTLALTVASVSALATDAQQNPYFTVAGSLADWSESMLNLAVPSLSGQAIQVTFTQAGQRIFADYAITAQAQVDGQSVPVAGSMQIPETLFYRLQGADANPLSLTAFADLVSGGAFADFLPAPLATLGMLTLSDLSFGLDCSSDANTSLDLSATAGFAQGWPILPSLLILNGVDLTVRCEQYFDASGDLITTYLGSIEASFKIEAEDKTFDVVLALTGGEILEIEVQAPQGGLLPSIGDMASLIGGATLKQTITDAMSDIGFTSLEVTDVSVFVRMSSGGPSLQSISIEASLMLFSLDFDLILCPPVSSGQGWVFNCRMTSAAVDIGTLIESVATALGATVTLPPVLAGLTVDMLALSIDTQTKDYALIIGLEFPLNKTTALDMTVTLGLSKQSGSYQPSFSGQFDVGDSQFEVSYGSDATFTATWTAIGASAIEFEDIAKALGFANPPTVPPDLDLGLKSVTMKYQEATMSWVFGAESVNYGNAAFVALKNSRGTRDFFFLLDVDKSFSLSSLPVVGSGLAGIGNLQIGNLQVIIGSAAADQHTSTDINGLIPIGYPQMPANGTTGKVTLSAQVNLGGQPLPLLLGMDSPSASGEGAAPSASEVAGTSPVTANADSPAPATEPTAGTGGSGSSSATSDGTTWLTVQKSFGPINIQQIAVRFASKQQTLYFEIDAGFTLGPITLTMESLRIGSSISDFKPQFSLQGMNLAYNKPPLLISGGFLHSGDDLYVGDASIETGSLFLSAFGEYAKDAAGDTSLALFAVLNDPPLGGPVFCFVTGIAAGFGYNSQLNIPQKASEVANFGLLKAASPPPPASATNGTAAATSAAASFGSSMSLITSSVTPMQGEDWLAVGILFRSFELVQSTALLTASFGHELQFALLGQSEMSLPPASTECLAYAQVDVEATYSPAAGALEVYGILSDNSYVFSRDCYLTGGFAYILRGSGDFILTFGGYAPSYHYQSRGYPTIPRIQLLWNIDSHTNIKGDEYFALTPAVMMAGGALEATWNSGIFSAWFSLEIDLFMQWRPFQYSGDFSMSLGVSFDLKIWFVHIHFTFHVGASLYAAGPPFHGTAHIDLDVISFDVSFGPSSSGPPPLAWSDFRKMLPAGGTVTTATTTAQTTEVSFAGAAETVTETVSPLIGAKVLGGLIKDLSQSADSDYDWIVDGTHFKFEIHSGIPVTEVASGCTLPQTALPTGAGSSIGVLPMAVPSAGGSLKVMVYQNNEDGTRIQQTAGTDPTSLLIAELVASDQPAAHWSQAAPSGPNDPSLSLVTGCLLYGGRPDPAQAAALPISALVQSYGVTAVADRPASAQPFGTS